MDNAHVSIKNMLWLVITNQRSKRCIFHHAIYKLFCFQSPPSTSQVLKPRNHPTNIVEKTSMFRKEGTDSWKGIWILYIFFWPVLYICHRMIWRKQKRKRGKEGTKEGRKKERKKGNFSLKFCITRGSACITLWMY